MRKVFSSSSDTIHAYAQRKQDEGRCSNVFFEGDRIYSYGRHYLLAKFIDKEAIWINDTGYSATTSKHISQVRYATRQYKQFFAQSCELSSVYRQVVNLKDKMERARKPWDYANQIISLFESLNEYLAYTKDKGRKKYKEYKFIHKVIKDIQKDGGVEKLQEARKVFEKKKKIAEQKKVAEHLKMFEDYEINSFRIGDEDYLRMSLDKSMVETTQGVRIPVSAAKRLYESIVAKKDIKGYDIEGYTVISINGTLKIGCHHINIDSMHKVGKQLLSIKA